MAAINSPNCSSLSGLVVFSAWRSDRGGIGLRGTLSAAKRGEGGGYWVYVCNTLSDGRVSFEEASEAVVFLAGQYMADQCHEDQAKAIAKEQEDDATELTVAT